MEMGMEISTTAALIVAERLQEIYLTNGLITMQIFGSIKKLNSLVKLPVIIR